MPIGSRIINRRIRLLNTHTFDVRRINNADTYYQNGVCIVPEDELFTDVIGHIQPITGKALQKIAEYAKDKRVYRFYSQKFEFERTDIIIYKGSEYEALILDDWDGFQMNGEHSFIDTVLVDVKEKN